MSTNHDMAFERLRRAKPVPVPPVHVPSAAEFLSDFEDELEEEPEGELQAWPEPGPVRAPRRPLLVAAAVVLVVGAAIGLVTSIDREPQVDRTTSIDREPSVDVSPPAEATFESSAPELPAGRVALPARGGFGSTISGVYRTDDLGTPVSMDLEPIWFLEYHEAGAIALSGDGSVSIIRPTALADPTELAADDPLFAWPASDLDGWLESVASSVTFVEATDSQRDGLRVFDIEVAEGLCGRSTRCVPFMSSSGTYNVSVGPSEQTRVWWFAMEPFVPVVVVATGPASTIQNADTLVGSMGFGPHAAHPLAHQETWEAGLDAELPAGRVALPALGGLEFELPYPVAMQQSDDAVVVPLTSLTRLEVLIADRAADGTSIATVAEATAVVESFADLTPAGSLETLLGEMHVVDVSDGPTTNSDVALLALGLGSHPGLGDDGFDWLVPRSGRLWMIEVEGGVLLVSAGVLEDSDLEDPTLEREVTELGEAVARTIRLGGD